jgi:flagellar hook-length control protein FliK
MEMQLNPENLGKIYLNVSTKEGMVNAQIAAQNEAVKEALETQIATLRENLNQAGVKVDAIEVTVASHEFEKNLEQNEHRGEQQQAEEADAQPAARRNIRMDSLDELSGLMTEEEILAAQIMKDNGNSVDLTA